MTHKNLRQNVDKAAALLNALANEKRLIILERLVQGETPFAELQSATGSSQSALSQQLATLREANLIECRKEEQRVFYRCDKAVVKTMINTISNLVEEIPGALDGGGFSKICRQCDNPFLAKTSSRKFCSDGCRDAAKASKHSGETELPNCQHCGSPFKPRGATSAYCSRACANNSYSRFFRRSNASGRTPD